MKSKKTYQKWLEVAYSEFAEFGPDFSIKALAYKVKLPRATLYYHCDSKEQLITELLNFHKGVNKSYQAELNNIENLIPDLYETMFKYKDGIKFHYQLLRHNHIVEYSNLYTELNESGVKILMPHIKKYFEIGGSDKELYKMFTVLTDAWYARLDFSNFNVESMLRLAEEIMKNLIEFSEIDNS